VERLVGLHQFEQLAADQFRVGRERHAQRCGVLAHAGPVALEGKKHAVDHADGAEDAPAGEQPYLSRREQLIGGIPDFFIMENETVHRTSFYRRGDRPPGLSTPADRPGGLSYWGYTRMVLL